ncbi:MAG TPA: hypothetical protein VIL36_01550 [Acidimicrobiales bacterium]
MQSLALAVVTAAVARTAVSWSAREAGTRRLAWPAAGLAAVAAAVVAAASAVPVAAGLAAGGIVAAAVVDAAERRIPTPVANGTTAVSMAVLGVYAGARGEAGRLLVRPGLLALALAVGLGLLWVLRAAGMGDVRLGAATVTAMVGGAEAVLLVAWCAFATVGLVAVGLHLTGHRPARRLPFGPGLAVGWLVAILATGA